MLERPLHITLKAYEPYVFSCAVEKRTLLPDKGCLLPGILPEVFGLVFSHLCIPYKMYTVSVIVSRFNTRD